MAAAGSAIRTTQRSNDGMQVTIAWTADASGDMAEGGTTGKATFTAHGFLHSIQYEPGTAADSYDVTLLDADDIDVLRGSGANQPEAASATYDTKYRSNFTNVDGNYIWFFGEPLTLTIANGGNLGAGTIKIKFSRTMVFA